MTSAQHIFLSMGDFVIALILEKTDREDKVEHFNNIVARHFTSFVIPKPKNTVDFTVYVKDTKGLPYIYEKGSGFSSYFTKHTSRSFYTYYFVSHYQLAELFKIILIHLLGRDGFLLHASAVTTPQGVVAFAGREGSGKSTTLMMSKNTFTPIADDCLIIRNINHTYFAYSSPHIEKISACIQKSSHGTQLNRIFFIHKNTRFKLKSISAERLTSALLSNIWIDNNVTPNQIRAVSRFVNSNKNVCFALYRDREDVSKVVKLLTEVSQS